MVKKLKIVAEYSSIFHDKKYLETIKLGNFNRNLLQNTNFIREILRIVTKYNNGGL